MALKVAGRPYGQHRISIKANPIDSISIVLKTPTLYMDARTISVAYQVRDVYGHSQVDIPEYSNVQPLLMIVSTNQSYAQEVIPCLTPDPVSGISTCTGELPNAWFSFTNDTQVEVFIITNIPRLSPIASVTEVVTLHKAMTFQESSNVGMTFTMPTAPLSVGQYVDVPIRANTGDQAMITWNCTMRVRKNILQFVSFATSDIYRRSNLIRWDDNDGVHEMISLSSAGIAQFVNSTYAEGPSVDLVAVRFLVLPINGSTSTVFNGVMTVFVHDMISIMTQYLAVNVYASIKDATGYSYRSSTGAQLTVSAPAYVGIMAYTPNSEVMNTAVLTGERTYSPITVEAITNGTMHDVNDIVTSGALCSVDHATALSLSVISTYDNVAANTSVRTVTGKRRSIGGYGGGNANCVVEVNEHSLIGNEAAMVNIQFTASTGDRFISPEASRVLPDQSQNSSSVMGLNTSVPMRVWYPTIVNVKLRDPTLNRII